MSELPPDRELLVAQLKMMGFGLDEIHTQDSIPYSQILVYRDGGRISVRAYIRYAPRMPSKILVRDTFKPVGDKGSTLSEVNSMDSNELLSAAIKTLNSVKEYNHDT